MASKDEENLAQVIEKIAKMDEPERSLVQRVHEVIMEAEPSLTTNLVRHARLCAIGKHACIGDTAQR